MGAKEGDERQVTVTFPPRSSVPQLAGKVAIFKVQCKLVQKRVLAEVLSEEFANTMRFSLITTECMLSACRGTLRGICGHEAIQPDDY